MSATRPLVEFHSELAYDALGDAMPLVTRLIHTPCTKEELERENPKLAGTVLDRLLGRLVRSGILRQVEDRYEATASFVVAYRQEGILSVVSQLFIPMILSLSEDVTDGILYHLDLNLTVEEQEAFRLGELHGLLESLGSLGGEATEATLDRCVIAFGAPNVPGGQEGLDRTLAILRHAARDRVDPALSRRAFLATLDTRLGNPTRAAARIVEWGEKFEKRTAPPATATYSVVLGLGRRPLGTLGAKP